MAASGLRRACARREALLLGLGLGFEIEETVMSMTLIGSAVTATAAAAVAAALPEANALLSPITESGCEFAAGALAMLISFPFIAVLTLVGAASGD